MIDIDNITVTQHWDLEETECEIEAVAQVSGKITLPAGVIAEDPGIVLRAKMQCALQVYDAVYGDLRDDVFGLIAMLRRVHPDQRAVDEVETRMRAKLGPADSTQPKVILNGR